MKPTRRETLMLALTTAGGVALPATGASAHESGPSTGSVAKGGKCAQNAETWPRGIENQRIADLGDGRFLNPVIAGDRPDPNVLKDGDDYYATFSSFYYYPGIPIWHSRDLVNWTPLTFALDTFIGTVWALDIAKHDGRYFIYIPALDPDDEKRPLKTWVIHADNMAGPWSEPIDMHIDNMIDPGHFLGEDGKRYLFFNGGNRVEISDDGLSAAGKVEHVYDGWPIPEDWVIEGFALEGPKLMRRDGWFYMFSGQGGTAGPPTSHMVVVARSRSIHGPWENCPHNPIVRTATRDEPWWSRGHATPVEGPDGSWWMVYHGYENGFRTLGRQMLLEPFEWTADGWPRALGGDLSTPLAKPRGGQAVKPGVALSDFTSDALHKKMTFYWPQGDYLDRAHIADGVLRLTGQGTGPADASPILFAVGERRYEMEVDVAIEGDVEAGLLLFYNEKLFCGIGLKDGTMEAYRIGNREQWPAGAPTKARRMRLRLVNDANVVTFHYRPEGGEWTKERSFEVSGYNHNIADGFLSLRPGIYAAGDGQAVFRDLVYRGLDT